MKLPNNWNEVTLGKFQELISSTENKSDIDLFVQQLSILADEDPEMIKNMPLRDIQLAKEDISFASTTPSSEIIRTIELEGIKYGLIPDLNQITLGEWIDIEERIGDNATANLHYILAVILRPVVSESMGSYEIEEYDPNSMLKRAELFKQVMPIQSCYGTALFFYRFVEEYTRATQQYLEMEREERMMKLRLLVKAKQRELGGLRSRQLKGVIKRIGSGILYCTVWLLPIPSRWKQHLGCRSSIA